MSEGMKNKSQANPGPSSQPPSTDITHLKEHCATCFFNDSLRRIDYVIVLHEKSLEDLATRPSIDHFLTYIFSIGVEYEMEYGKACGEHVFIKLNIPADLQLHLASLYGYQLSMRNPNFETDKVGAFKLLSTPLHSHHCDRPGEPTTAERSILLHQLLSTIRFGVGDDEFGISNMVQRKIVLTAYPLHDGDYRFDDERFPSERQLLGKYWASYRMLFKRQPLHLIKKYFGEEVGFYYGWLEFYNKMLVFASFFGLLSFAVGTSNVFMDEYDVVKAEVCNSDQKLCPNCEYSKLCPFVHLKDSCKYVKIGFLLDNFSTIVFAMGMSIWATVYMSLWRRRLKTLKFKWNLLNSERKTTVRDVYLKSATVEVRSSVTGNFEKYVNSWEKGARIAATYCLFLMLIALIVVLVMGNTIFCYKLKQKGLASEDVSERRSASLYAATVNALFVVVYLQFLQPLYNWLALRLTILECPRTEEQFETRFIHKNCILNFANNYAAITYLAFFKGKFYSYPGNVKGWHVLWGISMDLCGPGGCVTDVGIQVFTIMTLSASISCVVQCLLPLYHKFLKRRGCKGYSANLPRWEADFFLDDTKPYFLEREYRDLITQYGFITCFSAGCPFSPFLALIRNMFEVRIDAKKLLLHSKRPASNQIGLVDAFTDILQFMTYASVITNALVIAFASNFVPKLIYRARHDGEIGGFVNSTLSVFDLRHYRRNGAYANDTYCHFPGKRYPPGHGEQYNLSIEHYIETTVKFLFVFVFEHALSLLNALLAKIIPEESKFVRDNLAQQDYQTMEAKAEILNEAYSNRIKRKREDIRFPQK